jgi:hypothetical protein
VAAIALYIGVAAPPTEVGHGDNVPRGPHAAPDC